MYVAMIADQGTGFDNKILAMNVDLEWLKTFVEGHVNNDPDFDGSGDDWVWDDNFQNNGILYVNWDWPDAAHNIGILIQEIKDCKLSGTKMWILYHGTQEGEREDCSVFYTESELFKDEQEAKDREDELKNQNNRSGFYTHLAPLTIK